MLEFNDVLSDIGAAALFGAAILCLTRGRYAQRGDITLVGLSLLALGGMRGLLGDLRSTTFKSINMPLVDVVVLLGGIVLALSAMYLATSAGRVLRLGGPVPWFISSAGAVLLLAVISAIAFPDARLNEGGYFVVSALVTTAWLGVTSRYMRANHSVTRWLLPVLVLTAASSAARLPAAMSPNTAWLVVPGALALIAATVAVVGAMLDMREMVVDQRERHTQRSHELDRLHDVRSLVAGLQMATSSLSTYEDKIDASVRRRLTESVAAELSRLQQLIDPSAPATLAAVSLKAAITPVLDADAVTGAPLVVDIDDVPVLVHSSELAAIVSELLDNARLHAPGALVELRTSRTGQMLALEVRDYGPGIPSAEVVSVFGRGERGSRSRQLSIPGSGLGLFLARQRARNMAGDLTTYSPAGGGTAFVLTVPMAEIDPVSVIVPAAATTTWRPELSWLSSAGLRQSAGA